MNIKEFFGSYQRFIFSGLLFGCAVLFFWSLAHYQVFQPSLFYVDSSQKIALNLWFFNSVAAILFYLFGMSAWLLPIFFAYLSLVVVFSLWRFEWDRVVASMVFIFSAAFLWALSSGIVRYDVLLKGGVLGDWLIVYTSGDKMVQWVAGMTFLCASLIIISRMIFMVPVCYSIRFSKSAMAHNSMVRKICLFMWNFGRLICLKFYESGYCFYRFVTGKKVADEPEILFDQEQLEELSSLEKIVHDVVWQSQKIKEEKVEPSVSADPGEFFYRLPDKTLFSQLNTEHNDEIMQDMLKKQAAVLEEKLKNFDIEGKVTSIKPGPVVTCFEYQPQADTKLSKITALDDDLALALEALSLRILAPIPGTSVVGFEVANRKRHDVLFAEIIRNSIFYEKYSGSLPLILGKDTIGRDVMIDLAKMPHLLIAGSTGSGKSVCLNVMLMSLLCRKAPDELRLILIDPKRLEFSSYADIPHLLFPIVTLPKRAIQVLQWVVKTMEERYEFMAKKSVRSITDYHMRYGAEAVKEMPYIVVIIDELADLMMTAGKQVEEWLARIAQMARASGIHMIVATQRPSVDVITGLIKVNFPSRISFRVTSKVDSRTILDTIGAEKLLGRGDMLFLDPQSSQLRRVHGAYVTDEEIIRVVNHIHAERKVDYLDLDVNVSFEDRAIRAEDDGLFQEVLKFLDEVDEISISLLQRRFRIGFNRSARIIEVLEVQGLVASSDGGKTRKVIR